jgi:long-chain fatty acid transport protein
VFTSNPISACAWPPARAGSDPGRAAGWAALVALLASGWSVEAHANGFQIRTGSPDWSANAFAGMAAKGYDASTAWTNPAAMVEIDGNEIDLGVNGLFPTINFHGQNDVGGTPVSGSNGGNAGQAAVTPSLEGVWSLSPDLKLGLSTEVPFGQRTVYPSDFVGRYQALVSSISDVEMGISVAYRVTPTLSIGGGPIIDYLAARLTSAINTGPTAALTGDPVVDIHGNDWSAGYHLGVFWQPSETWRFGVDYRSRIGRTINGSQGVSIPSLLAELSPPAAAQLNALNTPVRTSITLPDVLTLSAVWQITPAIAGLATLQWTDWSVLQELTVTGANGASSVLALHFHSSWMGSLGVNYRPAFAPKLLLQGGVGLDETPVSTADRTPRLPNPDNVILGCGVTYALTPDLKLQAAYLQEISFGASGINYSSGPTAGNLTGSYKTRVSVVSLGVAWRF